MKNITCYRYMGLLLGCFSLLLVKCGVGGSVLLVAVIWVVGWGCFVICYMLREEGGRTVMKRGYLAKFGLKTYIACYRYMGVVTVSCYQKSITTCYYRVGSFVILCSVLMLIMDKAVSSFD